MKKYLITIAVSTLITNSFTAFATEFGSQHYYHSHSVCKNTQQLKFIDEFNYSISTMHHNMSELVNAKNQDQAFILAMIPHQQASISLAKILLQYSQDSELITFANKIITTNTQQIKIMRPLLDTTRQKKEDSTVLNSILIAYDKANGTMHDKMLLYCDTDNIDNGFIMTMIAHQQGAIDMANIYLKYGSNQELLNFAENIISRNTEEINFLQQKKVQL